MWLYWFDKSRLATFALKVRVPGSDLVEIWSYPDYAETLFRTHPAPSRIRPSARHLRTGSLFY